MIETKTKKSILFVDDDTNILAGLRRMLRSMRNEWDMYFAAGGPEALKVMEGQYMDLVVTDMRMPVMDGAMLLDEVLERYPHTIRFVLSGQSDRETIIRAIKPTHQFISKPCDADRLKFLIKRAFGLGDLIKNEELKRMVSRVRYLPCEGTTKQQLTDMIESDVPDIKELAAVIRKDPGISAKIMQIVNSAFFGMIDHVSGVDQAMKLLGLDIIKALIVNVHIAEPYRGDCGPFNMQRYLARSHIVARWSRRLAKEMNADERVQCEAELAGMLHNIGVLVFVALEPEKYGKVLQTVNETGVSLTQAERDVLGACHSEAGAYLLGLWGFADPIAFTAYAHHLEADESMKTDICSYVSCALYLLNQALDQSAQLEREQVMSFLHADESTMQQWLDAVRSELEVGCCG
ncbi:MAG: HDOD domain-containing protein [Spartobacteria bacterium]|nr:HDOD domain-containing protein [Spartobacteria bacterium]